MAAETGVILDLEGCLKGLVCRLTDDAIIQTGDTLLERRIKRAPLARRVWSGSWVTEKVAEVQLLFQVFGTHTSFLLRPNRVADYTETNQSLRNTVTGAQIGDGTTTTFQLEITRSLGSKTGSKKVMHPRAPLLELRLNTTPKVEGTDYTVDYGTGIVTFAVAPSTSEIPKADFLYDTPVRFLSDHLETNVQQAFSQDEVQQEVNRVDLIEVFDE
jgi:uncharacterized protein (TIGR02217 family)